MMLFARHCTLVLLASLALLQGGEATIPELPADAATALAAAGKGGGNQLAQETEKHIKRMASIDRIAAVGAEKADSQLVETAAKLRAKEQERHQRALARLAEGHGKSDKPHGKPQGKPDDKGRPENAGKPADAEDKAKKAGKPADGHEGHDHGDHEGHDHGKGHEGHDHGKGKDKAKSKAKTPDAAAPAAPVPAN